MKNLKINKEQILKMVKAIERELDIDAGANINRHRIHTSKKIYNRKHNATKQNKY